MSWYYTCSSKWNEAEKRLECNSENSGMLSMDLFDLIQENYTCVKHGWLSLKVPGPISQNGDIYSNDASLPKKSWFQISVKSVKPFGRMKRLRILQLPIPYCVNLIMVSITSHISVNIFKTVHF